MELTAGQEKLRVLMKRLLEDTRAGKISWRASGDLSIFSLVTTSGSVIVRSIDGDGQAPFLVELLNPNGVNIERIESDWEPGTGPQGQRLRIGASWNKELSALFESARSAAINLDGVITGILDEIEHPNTDADFGGGSDDDIPF